MAAPPQEKEIVMVVGAMSPAAAPASDAEIKVLLVGLDVHVEGGPIIREVTTKVLVDKGAQDIIDYLRGRGYRIYKVE